MAADYMWVFGTCIRKLQHFIKKYLSLFLTFMHKSHFA
ncbi:hypothetical protein FORC065_3315 [Yersinia enterocolitica]|nr:hypothetical protein FORC065_3315 [Yersinia enterocolitica]